MIQNRIATAILDYMQGQIREHPLAELIREITATGLSGALRLHRDRIKATVYFEDGELIFATSNLRAHRLREFIKRNGLVPEQIENFPPRASDYELASALIQSGHLKPEVLAVIRGNQVSEVLMVSLLWTEGSWEFDPRVRLAADLRVPVDVNRLLLECARHLPAGFIAARLGATNGAYLKGSDDQEANLLPTEGFVLSRASDSVTLAELTALSGVSEEESNRAIYALSLSGLVQRSNWPVALDAKDSLAAIKPRGKARDAHRDSTAGIEFDEIDEVADVEALFARLKIAKSHYDVLDVGRMATGDEIKDAYHTLARRFHPDRFHQSAPQLRSRVESAFARIAQAYETLSDKSLRADYDARRPSKPAGASTQKSAAAQEKRPSGARQSSPEADAKRAAASFQRGLDALQGNRHDEAIRFLAEAAMLSPRDARYRAHYGQALTRQPNTRRIAETELQAALLIEPNNASYRVMLAELYKHLGLQKRAEGELERALAVDPGNAAARSLLLSLRSKRQKS
jgi:curved DNA-binding protein CbpA